MHFVKAFAALLALSFSFWSPPVLAQADTTGTSGAVFALIDNNEWCPGGSVYVDLQTGEFMLHPRPARPNCYDANIRTQVKQGTLSSDDLQIVRQAVTAAMQDGLRREPCLLVVTNGGPNQLAITAPGFSDATPEDPGCWSEGAEKLHDELFRLFG